MPAVYFDSSVQLGSDAEKGHWNWGGVCDCLIGRGSRAGFLRWARAAYNIYFIREADEDNAIVYYMGSKSGFTTKSLLCSGQDYDYLKLKINLDHSGNVYSYDVCGYNN